ncbi:MAG: argininosuccinate lyase [Candidatus Gottesmanbacteria bacterium]|nr:argininosuccinate lyase [Candidatus Gottesmanbacteria bacterium]
MKKPNLVTAGFIVSEKQLALDHQMVSYDIWGTLAHVLMLYKENILKKEFVKPILQALTDIQKEVDADQFTIDPKKGAQLSLEAKIVEKAGDAGYSVHTGRSRNDQVMVTEQLYLRDTMIGLIENTQPVLAALLSLAKKHQGTVMPGYTHMQPAKATSFGQWALAYLHGFTRAIKTITDQYETYNLCPLGACESYGTSWPLDRTYTADLLGFPKVWEIPQDVVSSRGFVQLGYLTGMRDICLVASKLAQDLLLFTTFEYGMINLGDDVAQRMHPITGSSVMAQKKNPDALELVRATAPQLIGFTSIVGNILSGLPMGYNRDSREVKEYIDLGLSKTLSMVGTLASVLASLTVNKKRMMELVTANYSMTTDVADAISQSSGVGYRLVYKVVGQVVDESMKRGKLLSLISAQDIMKKASTLGITLRVTNTQLKDAMDPQRALEKRTHIGGSTKKTMAISLAHGQTFIHDARKWVSTKKQMVSNAKSKTWAIAKKIIEEGTL